MRRALAAVILAVSLWIGSLAWTGFILSRTVLDPGRSEAVADALLDDPAVHDQLVANIATGIEASLPDGVSVDRTAIEGAADAALTSPEVEALFRAALVDTHQAFLGEGDPPRTIDGGAFGTAARDALVAARPELEDVVPESPDVEIPLPTEHVPDLGPVRRGLDTAVPLLAGVAAFGALLALVIARNRPAVLRRAGIWAIGLSVLVLVFAFGVPAIAQAVAPSQAAVVVSLVGALAAASQGPALLLAAAGIVGILVSVVWRPAAAVAAPVPPPVPRRRRRNGRRGPPMHPPAQRIPLASRARPTSPPSPPVRPSSPPVRPSSPPVQPAPTRVVVPRAPRVVERGDEIPADARWVPGVGYVVDT